MFAWLGFVIWLLAGDPFDREARLGAAFALLIISFVVAFADIALWRDANPFAIGGLVMALTSAALVGSDDTVKALENHVAEFVATLLLGIVPCICAVVLVIRRFDVLKTESPP